MSVEVIINLLGVVTLVAVNIVIITSHFSKLSKRVDYLEKDLEAIHKRHYKDLETVQVYMRHLDTEMSIVHKLSGKIDTLIQFFVKDSSK